MSACLCVDDSDGNDPSTHHDVQGFLPLQLACKLIAYFGLLKVDARQPFDILREVLRDGRSCSCENRARCLGCVLLGEGGSQASGGAHDQCSNHGAGWYGRCGARCMVRVGEIWRVECL